QDDFQLCLSFRLTTYPSSRPSGHMDAQGNWVYSFNVLREHRHLRVEADSVVRVHRPRVLASSEVRLSDLGAMAADFDEMYDLLAPTEFTPHEGELREAISAAESRSDGTVAAFCTGCLDAIHARFRYEKGATRVQSSIRDILANGAGVCQDFAH